MQVSTTNKLIRQISALSQRKAYLDRRITEEMKRHVPHGFTLQRLKKLKLDAKDRIVDAQRQLGQAVVDASLMMTAGIQPGRHPKLVPALNHTDRQQRQTRQLRSS